MDWGLEHVQWNHHCPALLLWTTQCQEISGTGLYSFLYIIDMDLNSFQGLLLMSLVVTVVNLINLVVLEVGLL